VMSTSIVWFRRDLRVHDHPSLTAAAGEADRVVPVFVLDEALLDGRFASGPRTRFLYGCLGELRGALRARGADLVVRRGRPERELPALASEVGAERMHFAWDVSPYATARDARVEEAMGEAGVEVVRHPGLFVADVERPYIVFSPFHRAWLEAGRREVVGAPRALASPSGLNVGRIPGADGLEAVPEPFAPGEKAGRERMHAWLRGGISQYADRHDVLSGGTSELSPYLHFGCISPRELESKAGDEAFVRQLCWRDFYAHVLLNNPRNARCAYQERMDSLAWENDDEGFAAWCEGRTGFPVVDAGMRQLRARGWMHNRARLIVGSFLTKDLHIDWRRGEAHFMAWLVDGDEANNNGNWQWISSVGVDPAPYFRRMYNPMTQQKRHDPDGSYVRRWVPELRDVPLSRLAEPWTMTESEQREAGCVIGSDYPSPVVDHKEEREHAMARYRAASGR
jgi:deoxyribodipyrimidine photo-lyase